MLREVTRTILLTALALCGHAHASARQPGDASEKDGARVTRGSIEEIRDKRRVALLVTRGDVVDVRDPALVALDDFQKAAGGGGPRTHNAGFRLIAKKINNYIRKYKSMTAAESLAGADFVIVFKVTRVRRSFIAHEPFVMGKMFVVAGGAGRGARVVWESEGEARHAEEAASDFIKALKLLRNEK